jgi:hypothetical protein
MNNSVFEKNLDFIATPLISCPLCQRSSSDMRDVMQKAGLWDEVECQACEKKFEIATAIDEMFVKSSPSGFTLWTGGKRICVPIACISGQTQLVDIRGIFEEVYIMTPYFEHFECLVGGFFTKFVQQSYAMVAVAPNPDGKVVTMNAHLFIEGRPSGQPQLEPWMQMLLNAKLLIYDAPHMTIIMALNAVDLYLESATNLEIPKGRPGSWNKIIKEYFQIPLSDMLGVNFKKIEKFVQLRNALAHGKDHVKVLPKELVDPEEKWIENGKYYEGSGAFSPCAAFALKSALEVIRSCRRIHDRRINEVSN